MARTVLSMRSCEFSVQTSAGKVDCRTSAVEALVEGAWITVSRGAQLSRLERRHGVLELRIDGVSAQSAEGQHSRHQRAEHPSLVEAFSKPWQLCVQELDGEAASRCEDQLVQIDSFVRAGSWAKAEDAMREARRAWLDAVAATAEKLPHADTTLANRFRAAGIDNKAADDLAWAAADWQAPPAAERVAARAAKVALEQGSSLQDALDAAQHAGFLAGAERVWGAAPKTTATFPSGVVPAGGLILLAGPAGSGKSTQACRLSSGTDVRVISTDAIRKELFGDEAVQTDGGRVFATRDARVNAALSEGATVIVDATNLDKSSGKLLRMAQTHGRHITVVRLETPPERVHAQNLLRERIVPEEAVDRHLLRHAELDERSWMARGAQLVLPVSEAEAITAAPSDGWPARLSSGADVELLVSLGAYERAPDGALLLHSPYVARRQDRFERLATTRAEKRPDGSWALSAPR